MRKGKFRPRHGERQEQAAPQDFWSKLLGPYPDHEFLEKTACPACDGVPARQARILSRLGPTLLRKCRSCGLVFISPRLAHSVQEEMYRQNPSILTSERNLMLRHLMAERLQNMHREMFSLDGTGKQSSLLEVGCGWGHFLQLCRPHYRQVEGLELSKEQAAHARNRFDLEVSRADILRDPWPRQYNVIAAWEILEHLAHPYQFLEWSYAHLVPGGQLALSTPNYNSLFRRLLGSRWYYHIPSQHLCYFTPQTLKELLVKAGFQDVAVYTSGRSLLRERWNRHNRIDRRGDARDQWLETLRIREEIEVEREKSSLDLSHPLKKFWNAAVWRVVNALATGGFGDQMRVYARRG